MLELSAATRLTRADAIELARGYVGRTVRTVGDSPVSLAAPSSPAFAGPDLGQDEVKTGRYEMNAYTGGIAMVSLLGPTVFDLAGMETPKSAIPALYEHDRQRIVGVSDRIEKTSAGLIVAGMTFDDEPDAQRVKRMSTAGMPWQASVGIDVMELEFIDNGETLEANGRTFEGPLFYAARSRLLEASFVSLGADSETNAIAATRGERAQTMAEENKPSVSEAIAAERQRAKEIRAAFPSDADHALKHIEAGSSLLEAKADFADVLAKRVAEAETKQIEAIEAARKDATQAARSKQAPIPASGPVSTDPVAEWNGVVSANIRAGMVRSQAVIQAARTHGDLRQAMLVATNGGLGPASFGLQG